MTNIATAELDYTQRMNADINWALREGGMFFQNESEVQKSLRRITSRLNNLGIDYAVVGGMALFLHGFRRFTEDVDILVTREGLAKIHEKLEGSGYRPPFAGSKNLRDTENGVRIEFLIAGEFPGDGKPKPVAFPEPLNAAMERDGVRFLNAASIIELKIASGLTGKGRAKDFGDAQELMILLNLSQDFAEQLSPYVRERYNELWQNAQPDPDDEWQG